MDPFFEIVQRPIFVDEREVPNKLALVNQENGNVLGIVGRKYEVVKNEMVNGLFHSALENYTIEKVEDHLDSIGQKWKRRLIFANDDLNFEILPADIIGVMLEIFNSYNGKNSFGYELLGYRRRCENGMITGKRSLFSKSYHHFQNNPQRLLTDFQKHISLFDKNVNIWKKWSEVPFSRTQFAAFIEASEFIGERLGRQLLENYESILNDLKLTDTMWGAFNVITYWSTHKTKARSGSSVFSHGFNLLNDLTEKFYSILEH